jgi:serine/threonine protein kinase
MPAGPFTTLPRQFGRYRVEKLLGTGAMGAVYLAHDTQLARPVALKVPRLSGHEDNDIVNRLLREAKAAANLNHPNICRVYDAGVEAGTFYIAMEFIDGRLLSDFISPDHLQDERRSVNVVRKLAAALAEAHGKGIIHRDLKPANVKVRADGTVKVLDFGLAKAWEPPSSDHIDASASPTFASPTMTGAGIILGTAAYMSPEQARGAPVDKRTDIWAFGCVLFEMLAGRHVFGGAGTVSDAIAAVLKSEPEWAALPANTPPNIRSLLKRCLEKDARQRLRDIGDAGLLLGDAMSISEAAGPQPRASLPPARSRC